MKQDSSLKYYKKMLKILGSLTGLFSDSDVPFLYYRVTENLFCKAFSAKNLSRSDVSADASVGDVGILHCLSKADPKLSPAEKTEALHIS